MACYALNRRNTYIFFLLRIVRVHSSLYSHCFNYMQVHSIKYSDHTYFIYQIVTIGPS